MVFGSDIHPMPPRAHCLTRNLQNKCLNFNTKFIFFYQMSGFSHANGYNFGLALTQNTTFTYNAHKNRT